MKKILLLPTPLGLNIVLCTFFIFLSTILPAQLQAEYAISQTNQITGICLQCSLENPQGAVGENKDDFSPFAANIDR